MRITAIARRAAVSALSLLALTALAPRALASSDIVISQVYGGGGNSGATCRNDFIELFNRGAGARRPHGLVACSTPRPRAPPGRPDEHHGRRSRPGQYFLVQEAQGAGGTHDPAHARRDRHDRHERDRGQGRAGHEPGHACACGDQLRRRSLGPGLRRLRAAANDFEGRAHRRLSQHHRRAAERSNGCTDTDDNAADFTVGPPDPAQHRQPGQRLRRPDRAHAASRRPTRPRSPRAATRCSPWPSPRARNPTAPASR